MGRVDLGNIARRQAFPIPENISPVGYRCLKIWIPDDDQHEAIFAGAIAMLTKWNSWQRTGGNEATIAAQAWQKALYNHPMFERCSQSFSSVADIEDEMRLRVNPDDNCQLQIECKPGEWELFWDVSSCVSAGQRQPTDPGTTPEPGECRTFSVVLRAGEKWLLPLAVQTGYKISISNVDGAWNGGGLEWYCPDGKSFVLGLCTGSGSTDSGNPMPTAPTMSLIAYDGTRYYQALPNEFTIGASITDGQLTFQANFPGSNGSGTITFDVSICNAVSAGSADVTYTYGSGPSTLTVGQTVTMVSDNSPHEGDYEIRPCFSNPVQLQYISKSGWTPQPGDTNNQCVWDNCSSFTSCVSTIQSVLTQVDGMTWDSGTPWTITVKVISIG